MDYVCFSRKGSQNLEYVNGFNGPPHSRHSSVIEIMEDEKLNAYIDSIQRAGPRGGVVGRMNFSIIV